MSCGLCSRPKPNSALKVPPDAVVRLGTVKALAAAIDTNAWPPLSPLTLICDGRSDSALYIIPTGDGVILPLCDLAAAIEFPGQIGFATPGSLMAKPNR